MSQKPLILVCNDDGITAPGIKALTEAMNKIGEVYVVAPDSPQSGMSQSITINSTIFVESIKTSEGPQKEWSCSGTPTDSVKLALDRILPRRPDICVSGINHGSNSSISVLYSGTMSAAIEAGLDGIPAIGFSLCDFAWSADFTASKIYVEKITRAVLENGLPHNTVLNVNIPKASPEEIKGIKICRQANAKWKENFEEREDPRGRKYYWLSGEFDNQDLGKDTDEYALSKNFVSIVPVHFDMTAHQCISDLNSWDFK